MLSKESKIKVLENFYGIDYIFFGKSVTDVDSCCPLVKEEYLAVKGALMSVFIEMIKLMKHSPKAITEKVNTDGLKKRAIESAKAARFAAKKVVMTEKAKVDIRKDLKLSLKEGKGQKDVSKLVEAKIREKAFKLAVDNLLVARSLLEAKNYKAMNSWEGRIIEDSYKILRDNLCELAATILENE
jgi:hypothetical protein